MVHSDARLRRESDRAFLAGDWARLRTLADEVLERDPDHSVAQNYRAAATRMLRLSERHPDRNGDAPASENADILQVFKNLASLAASEQDIVGAFEAVAAQIRRVVPFDVLALGIAVPALEVVEFPGLVAPAGGPLKPGFQLPLHGSAAGAVIRTGLPAVAEDAARRAASPIQHVFQEDYGMRSNMLLPLHARGDTFGVLGFAARKPGLYGDQQQERAREVASFVATLLDHWMLRQPHDPPTSPAAGPADPIERTHAAANGATLTEREQSVLALLESGAQNKAIAGVLNLSVGTVKYHLGHIYQKLGATNRTEAVRIARSIGLLD